MRKVSARWHRWLGIMLILPLLGWGLTGLIFYYKPGYSQAYDKLMVSASKSTPLTLSGDH